MSEAERLLRSAYRAFNARDIEAAIELMDPEVDWPNAWEEPELFSDEVRAAFRSLRTNGGSS